MTVSCIRDMAVDAMTICAKSSQSRCIDNSRPHSHPMGGLPGACECLPGFEASSDDAGNFAVCILDLTTACDTSALTIPNGAHNCPGIAQGCEVISIHSCIFHEA
jgi:hypothetical protein